MIIALLLMERLISEIDKNIGTNDDDKMMMMAWAPY